MFRILQNNDKNEIFRPKYNVSSWSTGAPGSPQEELEGKFLELTVEDDTGPVSVC